MSTEESTKKKSKAKGGQKTVTLTADKVKEYEEEIQRLMREAKKLRETVNQKSRITEDMLRGGEDDEETVDVENLTKLDLDGNIIPNTISKLPYQVGVYMKPTKTKYKFMGKKLFVEDIAGKRIYFDVADKEIPPPKWDRDVYDVGTGVKIHEKGSLKLGNKKKKSIEELKPIDIARKLESRQHRVQALAKCFLIIKLTGLVNVQYTEITLFATWVRIKGTSDGYVSCKANGYYPVLCTKVELEHAPYLKYRIPYGQLKSLLASDRGIPTDKLIKHLMTNWKEFVPDRTTAIYYPAKIEESNLDWATTMMSGIDLTTFILSQSVNYDELYKFLYDSFISAESKAKLNPDRVHEVIYLLKSVIDPARQKMKDQYLLNTSEGNGNAGKLAAYANINALKILTKYIASSDSWEPSLTAIVNNKPKGLKRKKLGIFNVPATMIGGSTNASAENSPQRKPPVEEIKQNTEEMKI